MLVTEIYLPLIWPINYILIMQYRCQIKFYCYQEDIIFLGTIMFINMNIIFFYP